MVKRDMNASSTWFGRKVECCIGARPTVENQTRWWHLQLQSMLCVADLHHLLTAPSVHHMASTGFFLSLCQCLCFCLCQKSLCPFLCPYLLCNMFTSIAWASRNVGADAPHPNRTRSFDHDNVPLSQNKTLSLMSWKVDVFCHAELQILFVVGALATPWPDRQRDLQAPLDLTLCNIHRQAVLGLQSAQLKFGQPNYGGGSADICPWRGQGHQLLHTSKPLLFWTRRKTFKKWFRKNKKNIYTNSGTKLLKLWWTCSWNFTTIEISSCLRIYFRVLRTSSIAFSSETLPLLEKKWKIC